MSEQMEACTECSLKCLLVHTKAPYRSASVSSFFKVMYGKQFSNYLIIPPKFAKTLTPLVGKKTYLEDSSGKQWNVVLSKLNKSLVFLKGWKKFSQEHDIEMGDFVIFHYIKESHFVVQIYGRTGCEKLTLSEEEVYHSKKLKIYRDSVAENGPSDLSCTKLPVKEYPTIFAASQPYVDYTSGLNDVQKSSFVAGNVPRFENITPKTKTVPETDCSVDPCLISDRETSSGRGNENVYLNDLSIFEMPGTSMGAKINSESRLQENIHSQVSTFEAASIDIKNCHITKESTSSKYEEAFLIEREKFPPLSSCPKVNMPPVSTMLTNPVWMPTKSDLSVKSDRKTRLVKQEPQDSSGDFVGNAEAGISLGVFSPNVNLSSSRINNGQLGENANLTVKNDGGRDIIENVNIMVKTEAGRGIIVKPEPVDFSDSLAVPVVKVTCLVQSDSEAYLELPEQLPIKIRGRSGKFNCLVRLYDPSRRLWPVVYHRRYNLKVLTSGWNEFSKANNIQVGDQCTFVVENLEDGIFAVEILRS